MWLQGNCLESFDTVLEQPGSETVAGIQKRGTQCLLLFQVAPASNHSILIDLLSEVKSGEALLSPSYLGVHE